jgi:hypothetical protein
MPRSGGHGVGRQGCLNHAHSSPKKIQPGLETFSGLPNFSGVATIAIGMPSGSRHLRRAPVVSGAARTHFALWRIWLCAL